MLQMKFYGNVYRDCLMETGSNIFARVFLRKTKTIMMFDHKMIFDHFFRMCLTHALKAVSCLLYVLEEK